MRAMPAARRPLLLELDLSEAPLHAEAADLVTRLRDRARHRLRPTLRALHEAAADRRVVGLIAKVGGPLPWAVMQELRIGIRSFAASGKPTMAWAEAFGEVGAATAPFVLATAFDEIWLQPGGGIGPLGVGVETTFLRGALDRLGVEPQLDQRGEFKSAADRIMRTEFTEAHRASLDRLAESLFEGAVAAIAEGRGMTVHAVRRVVDAGPVTALDARDAGLVDALGYRDQAYAAMRERVGGSAELLLADRWHPPARLAPLVRRAGHVAIVDVHGLIGQGRGRRVPSGPVAGSDTVGAALRAASADERARAVVLRIDSGGGSAVASEAIWREVCRVRDSGRPVVASMGAVAASGGYLVACPADVIVALPATLTGSIGVFGGKVVLREMFDRLGLATGTVSHGDRSLMYSMRRGFTDEERQLLAATLDAIYRGFVAKVADGRCRSVEEVEEIARGRVWTGVDALRIGLVDELGGMRAALRIARTRAGLPPTAPAVPAVHVPPLARIRRARNTEDPRALASTLPALRDVLVDLGATTSGALLMPSIRVQ